MTDVAPVASEQEKGSELPAPFITEPAPVMTEHAPVLTDVFHQLSSRDTAGVEDARAGGFPIRVQTRRRYTMEKVQQYRGEALRRVPQFLDAHPVVFGAVNASDARKELDAALTKLDSAVDIQGARNREAKGEKNNQDVLERNLRDHHMMPVVRFALGKLAGTPNIAALTPSAGKLKGARLADAARAMAVAAAPYTALFTAATFPADFAQQLTDAANAIQASIDARRRKIADRKNATSSIEAALKDARAVALQVEAVVGRLVPRGTPLHDEWMSVKRVVDIASRPKTAVTPAVLPATAPQAQEGTVAKVA